jgi:hypothetical protein
VEEKEVPREELEETKVQTKELVIWLRNILKQLSQHISFSIAELMKNTNE